jgi:hypothetical protein
MHLLIAFLVATTSTNFADAACARHPDQGRIAKVVVEKVIHRDCSCKNKQGVSENFTIPGCVIQGPSLPADGASWNDYYTPRPSFPYSLSRKFPFIVKSKIPEVIHREFVTNNESFCATSPGSFIEAKISFECHDVIFPPPTNESCSSVFINAMCARQYGGSIRLEPITN